LNFIIIHTNKKFFFPNNHFFSPIDSQPLIYSHLCSCEMSAKQLELLNEIIAEIRSNDTSLGSVLGWTGFLHRCSM